MIEIESEMWDKAFYDEETGILHLYPIVPVEKITLDFFITKDGIEFKPDENSSPLFTESQADA